MRKAVLLAGAVTLFLVLAFPPIMAVSRSGQRSTVGHSFILTIPAGSFYTDFRIDYAKYGAMALGVLVSFGFGALAFKRA